MKNLSIYKFIFFLLGAVLLLGINSCNDSILEDEITEDVGLKSAKVSKISYVVVLADTELNVELSKLKGYEKKGLAVKSTATKILKRVGITDGEIGYIYSTALQGFSIKIPPGQFKKLQDDPSVKMIEEDIIVSLSPPRINKKPVLPIPEPDDPSQVIPWGITRVGGGTGTTFSGVAWIIDTGIDLDHPDLNVDASRGEYFVRAKSPDDDNGHGTHVAGTVAAYDNDFGVVGVAPGATVIPVKVLDRRGSGSISGVIAGVDFVAANGKTGDVANMSLGGGVSTTLDEAVLRASTMENKIIKFSLAAGNESDDADNYSPARVNGTNIYTISAMWEGDTWASFSNYGPEVDYCAPGVYILSCYKNGGYETLHGTSMAAPHVAGLLLLGAVKTDGYVNGDPHLDLDGNADPIAHN